MAAPPPRSKENGHSSNVSTPSNGQGVALAIPDELVDALADRVADRLADRQAQHPAEPELLTVGEAADLLRCKPQRVYDLMSQRRLPRLKDGSNVLIRRADLFAYLEGGVG